MNEVSISLFISSRLLSFSRFLFFTFHPPGLHSSGPRPLFLSLVFRPADWCLFLSSISVLLLVSLFSPPRSHPPGVLF